jgi:hypothetical protein
MLIGLALQLDKMKTGLTKSKISRATIAVLQGIIPRPPFVLQASFQNSMVQSVTTAVLQGIIPSPPFDD